MNNHDFYKAELDTGEKAAKPDKRYEMIIFNLNYLAFMDTASQKIIHECLMEAS